MVQLQLKEMEKERISSMSYRDYVRRVVPYVPGEQPGDRKIIKLNTNENPYPPAPGVEKALREMQPDRLRLYPDPCITELTEALARYHGVEPEQVFVGVGSDDVLAMSFLTFFHGDKPILFPDITYSFYDVWAELFGIPYKTCPLDEAFQIHPEDYRQDCGGVIFANPNAPTGLLLPLAAVEEILQELPDVTVIVDEAYIDFGGESCLPLLDKYENLLVVRTFSKSRSLAGMRIGYAIGNPEMIGYLNDVKFSFNSYTMNLPAIRLGVASVEDEDYFVRRKEQIIATRERSKEELRKLGFTFPDSATNFLFVKHPEKPAEYLFEQLKKQGIYVRYFKKPRIQEYLRISIGTDQEMDALFEALRKLV